MALNVLYVESRPVSPEQAADYHGWYDETHIPEILALDGFVSGRRFGSLGDDGSFVAIYEIDSDVEAARAALAAATKSGSMTPPTGVRVDPPPTVRWLLDVTTAS